MSSHARSSSIAKSSDTARHRTTASLGSSPVLPSHNVNVNAKVTPSFNPQRSRKGVFIIIFSLLWKVTFSISVIVFLSSLFGFFYTPESSDFTSTVDRRSFIPSSTIAVIHAPNKEPQLFQHIDLSDPSGKKNEPDHRLQLVIDPVNTKNNEGGTFFDLHDKDLGSPVADGPDENENFEEENDEDKKNIRIRRPGFVAGDWRTPLVNDLQKLRVVRGKAAFREGSKAENHFWEGKRY